MPFKTGQNSPLGMPNFQSVPPDTSPQTPIGNIVTAYDDVLGFAEFIYLPGAANVAANDLVAYDLNPAGPTVTRAVAGAGFSNSGRPLATPLVALGAGTFGWYQISGVAIVNAIAGSTANSPVYMSATTGSITTTAAAGAQLVGARTNTAVGTPAAGKAYVTLQRPCAQTQIT